MEEEKTPCLSSITSSSLVFTFFSSFRDDVEEDAPDACTAKLPPEMKNMNRNVNQSVEHNTGFFLFKMGEKQGKGN